METKFDTQRAKVKAYLESGKSITSWEAIEMFHCTRLSAVIFSLKNDYGMNIVAEMVSGDGVRYAKYFLKADSKLKGEIKDYLMRGNYLTKEVAEQVFECKNINLVLDELKEEGLNIVSKRRKPLCGKEFTIWTIEK